MSAALKLQPIPSQTTILEGDKLNSLLSGYLNTGFKEDTPIVRSLEVTGRKCHAKCEMKEFFSSTNFPGFHLSFTMGQALLTNAFIAHALQINGIERKECEVILTDLSIKLVKAVRDPMDMQIDGKIISKIITDPGATRKTHRTYFTWQYSVNNDAWNGHLTMCFPFKASDNS